MRERWISVLGKRCLIKRPDTRCHQRTQRRQHNVRWQRCHLLFQKCQAFVIRVGDQYGIAPASGDRQGTVEFVLHGFIGPPVIQKYVALDRRYLSRLCG
jgi:hypothetical protein